MWVDELSSDRAKNLILTILDHGQLASIVDDAHLRYNTSCEHLSPECDTFHQKSSSALHLQTASSMFPKIIGWELQRHTHVLVIKDVFLISAGSMPRNLSNTHETISSIDFTSLNLYCLKHTNKNTNNSSNSSTLQHITAAAANTTDTASTTTITTFCKKCHTL